MLVTIKNTKHELFFGFDFLEYINKEYGPEMPELGVKVPAGGINFLNMAYSLNDPVALAKTLIGATISSANKISKGQAEEFVFSLIEDGKFEDFYNEVKEEVKKDRILKAFMTLEEKKVKAK